MLDIKIIRNNPERVQQGLVDRGFDQKEAEQTVERLLVFDTGHRDTLTKLQDAQARSNTVSEQIGMLMREGKKDEAQTLIGENKELK